MLCFFFVKGYYVGGKDADAVMVGGIDKFKYDIRVKVV